MRQYALPTLPLLLFVAGASPAHAAELATPPPNPIERIRGLADRLKSGELSTVEKDALLEAVITQLLSTGNLESQARPQGPQAVSTSAQTADRVIATYADRNTTQLVIEARQPLVAGSLLYAGPKELQITLDDLMARSGDLYYYSASTPGKARIHENDAVVTQQKRKIETPSALRLKIQESYTFEQKRVGEITAVQDGRAMVDRGTLHEVRERDIYKVFDASGGYKGFLEIRGIGDLQSSGVLYNRMEDRKKRVQSTTPGDRTVFVGQRKLLALGAHVGSPLKLDEEFGAPERAFGGGLAWNLMFKNGWGIELLFGAFERRLNGARHVARTDVAGLNEDLGAVLWNVRYYAPFVVRKNFFFPSVASPFILVGGTVVDASLRFREMTLFVPAGFPAASQRSDISHHDSKTTVAPILGGGVDFFPARLIRPRLELRWIAGPTLRAGHKTLNTETFLGSVSLFTAW